MNKRNLLILLSTLVLWLALACDTGEPTATLIPTATGTPLPTATATPVPTATPASYSPITVSPTMITVSPTITVTDSRGRDVVFDRAPQRIVSISPAHTEILYALGLGDRVVGTDSYSNFPPEAGEKPRVGDAFTLNLEVLAALEPDLLYTTFEGPVADAERLGIKVLYLFPADDLQGVLDNIALLGRITDREAQANALVADMESRIDSVVSKLAGIEEGPRLYYELDPALFTVGPDTFIGSILEMLKVQNIAEGADSPYPMLSAEVIVQKNPEVIVLGDSKEYLATGITVDELEARPGWGSITAVQEDKIYPFDADLLSRPGPRIVDGIEQLAGLLYPELFP
ncbi:MAG: ABC transporter substrate-binding protein [Chloroflexota bacterium]